MAEVTKQIGPLTKQVDKLDSNLERLYNSNGGPPGYIQNARAEDKREREIDNSRFDMIFAMLQEFKDAVKPVTLFMSNQEQKEKDLALGLRQTEKRSNRNLVILGLVFSAISLLSANMQGCKNAAHSFFSPDQNNHSAVSLPQQSDSR